MREERALQKKARQAQIIYEDLLSRFGIDSIPTTFVAAPGRKQQFVRHVLENNPFPKPIGAGLYTKSVPAVLDLFQDETIVQTGAIAAVLAACSSVAAHIGALRGDDVSDARTYCDVAFAGIQAVRLYVTDYDGKEFAASRWDSASHTNNAFNGVYYKYLTKDNRLFSYHVYYQSQQKKLAAALHMSKPGEAYTFYSTRKDRAELTARTAQEPAAALEELSFDCGASACILRSRAEWEAMEVGKAVCAMPLVRVDKTGESEPPVWGRPNSRGPLSGLKVLDLTHIIAGPACSRILTEYGADVLLVRRGRFMEQEQSMTELDGWAGKHSIQLDFNVPEQLERAKALIREADIVTYSYQNGALDHFGLSEADIRALNPNVIYSNMMCFSDSVWKTRPGWAPLAEDITGLSARNGTLEQPKNLNGVPLDYFPGMLLALGTLLAVERRLREGGGYQVTTSLTRGAQYLHECSDLCERSLVPAGAHSTVTAQAQEPVWDDVVQYVHSDATGGKVGFPSPAAVNTAYPFNKRNLYFSDGNTGWRQQRAE